MGKYSEPKISIGKKAAIALYDSEWWKNKTHREIVQLQLFIAELCCPFDIFHEAVEKILDRPVFTHEFGLNYNGICKEFLDENKAPTINQIIEMIPEEKRILVRK